MSETGTPYYADSPPGTLGPRTGCSRANTRMQALFVFAGVTRCSEPTTLANYHSVRNCWPTTHIAGTTPGPQSAPQVFPQTSREGNSSRGLRLRGRGLHHLRSAAGPGLWRNRYPAERDLKEDGIMMESNKCGHGS